MKTLIVCLMASVLFLAGCGPEEKTTQIESAKAATTDTVATTVEATTVAADLVTAKGVLDSAIAKAKADDKKLFVHFGAKT